MYRSRPLAPASLSILCSVITTAVLLCAPVSARAEQLCDPSFEDCRARLLELIRAETVGIDVAFWFMEDARYSNELIKRAQAGVPIRVIIDPRANSTYPLNADRLAELAAAGLPMRKKVSSGILHWKMMLFDGQDVVQFSAANYSPWALKPVEPYLNYTDEVIYFSSDPSVVNSFRTKYDDLWTNTSGYATYANITTPLVRRYARFSIDPELNFPPLQSYRSRAVRAYDAEQTAIDVTMFRITDRAHTDAMIRAINRGVPVRLITEPDQYRDPTRYWHAWNVDRLYVAGAEIRHRAHQGSTHQKSITLSSQGLTIFGSSNWTSPSSSSQEEHNYFTVKPTFFQYFTDQFDRKWNNLTGNLETKPFVPLPPGAPAVSSPANLATGVATSGVVLRWVADLWSHKYDVYFGTTPDPALLAANLELGPSVSASDAKQYSLPALAPGTTYYWRIASKTMAGMAASSAVRSFTTAGSGGTTPPPPSGDDVVIHPGTVAQTVGQWTIVSDASAASGAAVALPNANVAKISTALASPADYFEVTFNAQAGMAYRVWIRGRAQSDYWGNDSVHVQFSGSVNENGATAWRIGTTSSTEINLEDCSGCGLSGWGWQDNGWGVGVMGPIVRFAATGPQTMRVQAREDGLRIDQIVLSPSRYFSTAPGALKNDATILAESDGSGDGGDPPPPPPPPPPTDGSEILLYAASAPLTAGAWVRESAADAAGGALLRHPDGGAAKILTPLASPVDYFELTFDAVAGVPYRLWIRGRAERNYWGNDSVHVQFTNSVDANGTAAWRIGTSSSTEVNLEDCSGCGLSGWGWQDNGWGVNVAGPVIRFATTGRQTIRIQTREDGFAIDQIVLSSSRYLTASPGALRNDTTILR
jgi:hypothetical protein